MWRVVVALIGLAGCGRYHFDPLQDAGDAMVTPQQCAQRRSFPTLPSIPDVTESQDVALADLDRDGDLDVILSQDTADSIRIHLNKGDGTFDSGTTVSAGDGPSELVTGDFDANGTIDVAVANGTGGTVSVFAGMGNGTVAPQVTVATLVGADAIATADLDGDGKLDLAVVDRVTNQVFVLVGAGNGSFGSPSGFTVGMMPNAIAIGDFDANGSFDVAVTAEGADVVSILRNNGNGTFQPKADYPTSGGPSTIKTGDVDGDGRLDLVTADLGSTMSVFHGNANGTFAPRVDYPTAGSIGFDLALADVSGDGKLDIIVPNQGEDMTNLFINNGSGMFGTGRTMFVGPNPWSVAVGDLDRDGLPDMVLTEIGADAIVRGSSTTNFEELAHYDGPAPNYDVAIADVNNDGVNDVLVSSSTTIRVWRGTGGGALMNRVETPIPFTNSTVIVAAKLDADAFVDVVLTNGTANAYVALGNGDGTFSSPTGYPTSGGAREVALGDFDNNGTVDLAVIGTTAGVVSILPGNGAGIFGARQDLTMPAALGPLSSITVADLNADGNQDLVVSTSGTNNVVATVLGMGNGAFQAPAAITVQTSVRSAAVADFDGDGKLDIVASGLSWFAFIKGNGAGGFAAPAFMPGLHLFQIATGNIVTPRHDLLAIEYGNSQVVLLPDNGDGTFGEMQYFNPGAYVDAIAVGDLDGTGGVDYVVSSYAGIALSLNACPAP